MSLQLRRSDLTVVNKSFSSLSANEHPLHFLFGMVFYVALIFTYRWGLEDRKRISA